MAAETAHGLPGIVGRDELLVPSWAEHLHRGDAVAFETPEGVLEARVIGFSEREDMYGHPAVDVPEAIADAFEADVGVLVLREQDLVGEGEV